jgi:excisionase family DNA binding protein
VTAARLELPPELVELIAERAAELLAERIESSNGDGWLRGADAIASYIGAPRSRVYALASAGRIPVERDGASLLAKRSTLDAWITNGGGKRP